jgi:hypothetical protein
MTDTRIHAICGQPMNEGVFAHNDPTPANRSQPMWHCGSCSAWEPREGWDGLLPAEWDEPAGQWRS